MTILLLYYTITTLLNFALVHLVLEQLEHITLVLGYVLLQYVVLHLFVALLYVVQVVVAFALYTSQIYLHRHAAYAPALYITTVVILRSFLVAGAGANGKMG
tara:strand:+ start:223 stop:528 length:306 start_codon:yes stop_codon:yes gene_type:complete